MSSDLDLAFSEIKKLKRDYDDLFDPDYALVTLMLNGMSISESVKYDHHLGNKDQKISTNGVALSILKLSLVIFSTPSSLRWYLTLASDDCKIMGNFTL